MEDSYGMTTLSEIKKPKSSAVISLYTTRPLFPKDPYR
jgi:hypothetical protein